MTQYRTIDYNIIKEIGKTFMRGEAMEEYVSVSKAARMLGVSRSTFYRWAKEGKITVYKPTEKTSRVKVSDIEKLVEQRSLYED